MSAIAFGIPVQFDKAHVEGITKLQAADIAYAEQLGYRIKLLGITRRRDAAASSCASIRRWCRAKRLIANVEGAMNAVLVQGDAVGTTLYYGKGAGAEPTASAVVADLVDITRLHTADPDHRVPHLAFQPDELRDHADPADRAGGAPRSTCACRWPTRPACWRASPASSPSTDISIDALLQRPSRRRRAKARPDRRDHPDARHGRRRA